MSDPSLSGFTPQVQAWFERAFAGPTEAQKQAWPAIASGEHVLISAPTGSGKTLAAFLWGLDRFIADPPVSDPTKRSPRLVYISPLKALSYDIEKNLRAPLRGLEVPITVGVRTGDTPQSQRRAMLRTPPDILITTPESLYLMLTSQAQEMFTETRWVIVDEIHAVAQSKRGAHLAVTIERLSELTESEPQRIGLSATQNPLAEVGRFLVGPTRKCTLIDTGLRKELDLKICVPVQSMVEPDLDAETAKQALDLAEMPGQESTRNSIWPAIYPRLLDLIEEHTSTLVFVNNRRAAERIAIRLNELAAQRTAERTADGATARDIPPANGADPKTGAIHDQPTTTIEIARAHHGSLAREERLIIEDQLKSGELPCLVATSSLELGIDMGAVDLVIQIESPKSVTRGLQRIGRSGHSVTEVSKGRIFPKFRADLLECAVVTRRMREGLIETTVIPRNPLDVLAQQLVAMAAASEDSISVDDAYTLVTRTYSYADLSKAQFENVLDMLDGRYPSEQFGELRARIVWSRSDATFRARKGARQLAIANAGTIPDRGLFSVNLPDGRRVGELDEEMVHETRPGQVILLGASSWRIEEITRDRVIVTPAPGVPGAVPFWRGDGVGRPRELGEAIGKFSRWAIEQDAQTLVDDYDLDRWAADNLLTFLREQQQATTVLPSDRTIVVERFRDEIGDWRLCLLSPFGGRVHAAWGLAVGAKIRERYGLESDAIWSDDGIIVHLPEADEAPSSDLVLFEPDELEDLIVSELATSALFGARFRENAGRALLIPRAYPGRRTPLWQQRLKSQSLLEVARQYPQFPIVLETYRECMRDVLDVPGLIELMRALQTRQLGLVETETATASPFATSLLFDYVATYMYEGDTPNAERRAAALALDRDLLQELLGQEELRELIDPDALEQVESELQRLDPRLQADSHDALHEVLRWLGDLTTEEAQLRCQPGTDVEAWFDELVRERRAVTVRIAGQPRFIAAEDVGLYRDALAVVPPGGLPAVFLETVDDARERIVRRFARSNGPFETQSINARYESDFSPELSKLELAGELVRGELRPGGSQREWCDPEVLRRLRRASLAALRREIEPVEQAALGRFMPAWQRVDRNLPAGAGIQRLREVLVSLQRLALPAQVWETDVLPRRVGAYSPSWLDALCASGEVVWVGSGSLGRRSGRVVFYFREDAPVLGPPPVKNEPPRELVHELIRERLAAGAAFFSDLLIAGERFTTPELEEALWDLVWAGEVTNDAFAPVRIGRRSRRPWEQATHTQRMRQRRFGSSRTHAQQNIQGRWSLTASLFSAHTPPNQPGMTVDRAMHPAQRRALAELLLERYGVLTREHVRAEAIPGGFVSLYEELIALETLGIARRGYFIAGLGGAQFALPGAVERLRMEREDESDKPLLLAATDPAQPYGSVLRWPDRDSRSPARQAGAYVILVSGEPIVYIEKGAKGLQTLVEDDDERVVLALSELIARARNSQLPRLQIERINGESALSSSLGQLLIELGLQAGPRKLTLR